MSNLMVRRERLVLRSCGGDWTAVERGRRRGRSLRFTIQSLTQFIAPRSSNDYSTFSAKPMVLLVGQYSVGKTSFIRYLLGRDFPGQRIGPEPTTDRFTVLLNGPEERTIPGNALSVHPDLPFRGLDRFGVNFLSRLEGSQMPSSVLKSITLVDTPGILSGEKQRTNRGYDFTKGTSWQVYTCLCVCGSVRVPLRWSPPRQSHVSPSDCSSPRLHVEYFPRLLTIRRCPLLTFAIITCSGPMVGGKVRFDHFAL